MTSYFNEPKASNNQVNFSETSDMHEAEIAYFLHNCQPGDPQIIEILIRNYADEVLWLIELVLFEQLRKNPSSDTIIRILIQTFTHAIKNINQFRGEESVRNWLFAIATHKSRTNNIQFGNPVPFGNNTQFGEEPDAPVESHRRKRKGIEFLNQFSHQQRLVILLRYALHLDISDIARILEIKERRVHAWLTAVRRKLLSYGILPADNQNIVKINTSQQESHKDIESRIHAYSDGFIEKNSEEDILLRDHLLICVNCKAYADSLNDLEGQAEKILKDVYPRPNISDAEFEQLIQSIEEYLPRSKHGVRIAGPLRKVVSMSFILVLIISTVFTLIRITPERGEFPATPTPTQHILPTPIGPNKSMNSNEDLAEDFSIKFYALQPKISADGRWIVFVSNVPRSEGFGGNNTFDIMIYDTQAQTLDRIASHVLSLDESLFTSPGISADGRWVVFSGYADRIDDEDEPCRKFDNNHCIDILLYDRNNRDQKRITNSYLGGPANGDSIQPQISENGRWIVFWSFASNLVEEETELCIGDGGDSSCGELYIYDLLNQELEQVPIGRLLSQNHEPEDIYGGIDITNDGRWILIPILDSDRIADQVGLNGAGGLYLYDREERLFEPVYVAYGDPGGNGMSFSGSLTPDGNYVVFHTGENNPSIEDENNFADVFLFDRTNGSTEIISNAPDGTPGDGDSGIDIGLIGNVAITNDGRFVAFMSTAGNLVPGSLGDCIPSESNPCISIYVYDRITGGMENIAVPQSNSIHVYPTISDNGRWISYLEVRIDCDDAKGSICVDLNLYDRERGWTSKVTRNLYPRQDIPWELEKILETKPSSSTGIKFSPDGEAIALFGTDRYVRMIDAAYGEELVTFQGDSRATILELSFSPDGKYVAGGASDGTVNIWRISDGSLAYLLNEHPGRIVDIKYSADGEYLYFSTPKAVWMWHRADRKYTRVSYIEYSDVTIQDIDISPSNELLVMVPTQDPSIWIQRLPTGDVIHRLTGYGSMVSSVSFSPDGNYLIVPFSDGLLHIWQLEIDALGSITPTLVTESNLLVPYGNIDLSPDGAYAATGSLSIGVQLLDVSTGHIWTIPGSNNMRLSSGVVFSPDGHKLAASSIGAGVYIWTKTTAPDEIKWFKNALTDESFQIQNQGRPIQEALLHLDLDRKAVGGLTLYEAADRIAFNLYAPLRLPTSVTYVESSTMHDGGVLVHYRVDDLLSAQPIADLYFRQQEIYGTIQPIPVGKTAVIEDIQINHSWAEYVQGDWLSISTQEVLSSDDQDKPNVHWTWSSASDIQQMRWQRSTQLLSLSYIPRSDNEQPSQSTATVPGMGLYRQVHLTKYDLIEIASGIDILNRSVASDMILTNYTVKPGDTCTSIALRYGTTAGTLLRLNKQIENCLLIVEGQTLIVPLPNERLPLTEVDLDCDGKFERVRLVPTPLYVDPDISQGILLEVLSDIGLYEKRWLYTVAEDAENIAQLQILPSSGCQQLLALNVLGLTEESESGLKVFEWDAETMKLIFRADGWFQSVDFSESGFSLTTLALEYVPGMSTCDRTLVTYTWNGKAFNETSRTLEEGGSCEFR